MKRFPLEFVFFYRNRYIMHLYLLKSVLVDQKIIQANFYLFFSTPLLFFFFCNLDLPSLILITRDPLNNNTQGRKKGKISFEKAVIQHNLNYTPPPPPPPKMHASRLPFKRFINPLKKIPINLSISNGIITFVLRSSVDHI